MEGPHEIHAIEELTVPDFVLSVLQIK